MNFRGPTARALLHRAQAPARSLRANLRTLAEAERPARLVAAGAGSPRGGDPWRIALAVNHDLFEPMPSAMQERTVSRS